MKLAIKVSDMTCNHCKMTIEKAVNELPLVRNVMIDLSRHLVKVEGDMAVDQVMQAIKGAGYTVSKILSAG
jgi:copper chaperone